MTSCVSSMHSTVKTAFMAPETAFFGRENGVFQSATLALHWRFDGAALDLHQNRH